MVIKLLGQGSLALITLGIGALIFHPNTFGEWCWLTFISLGWPAVFIGLITNPNP